MSIQQLITILTDGLVFASYLFLVSVGLTIVFGVMKLLNFAHGSFYAFGAYTAAYTISTFTSAGAPIVWSFIAVFGAALLVGITLGLLVERLIIRPMYGRDEVVVLLATFGVFLMLEDVILFLFGGNPYFAFEPVSALGITHIAGVARDNYSLSLVALAIVIGAVCWISLNRTRWGKLLQVVMHDRELGQTIGINVNAVSAATFVIGATLGALGGSYAAPLVSVAPGLGAEVIILSFAVVVIGGMGSIQGAIVGALIVGVARSFAIHKMQEAELFVVYLVMVGVLIFRPRGLFPPAAPRVI
jgi:branched-chain amino acid transport system permease protein